MFDTPSTPGKKYLFAFLLVMAAVGTRYALSPMLGEHGPLLIFTLPVTVTAMYFGFRPAILATVLSYTAGTYLFVGGLGLENITATHYVLVLLFLVICLIISHLGGQLARAQHEAQERTNHLKFTTKQLQEAAEKLKAVDKRKDEFISMLGHELRNPLAGISTASELLQHVRVDEQRHTRTTDIIRRQVDHMAKLLDELLDVARVAHGLIQINKKTLDLVKVVDEAIAQCEAVLKKYRHRLTLDVPRGPAWLEGDQTRLVQVISNLITNAAKYSPPGSHITVLLKCGDGEVMLMVEDNGNGLSPELLPNVFDAFVQGE